MKLRALLAASVLGSSAVCSSALAGVRTYTMDFFPDEPVQNRITSLSLDPRRAEPFLAGATIVGARIFLDFAPSNGFAASDLTFSLLVPLADSPAGLWIVNGGTDLGWTGAGPYTATLATTVLNGTIPESGRAVWFWDIYSGADVDPPSISGSFGITSRVEIDYSPVPRSLASVGETICATSPATFSVRSSCDGVPAYEWQVLGGPATDWTTLTPGANIVNGQLLATASGVSTDTLTVAPAAAGWPTAPGTELAFRCVVTTSECGAITSNEVSPPVASGQPAFAELAFPFTTCFRDPASLNVFPDGVPPFSFAWRKNGTPINPAANPSATEATLTLAGLTAADSGSYDCLVTDACGTVGSMSVTISVCPADFDCSGQRTIDDIFIYLNEWFAGGPRADFDGSGARTIDDIFVYLNAWFAGC